MAAQHGGLTPDRALQDYVDRVGNQIVNNSAASEAQYPYEVIGNK